MKMKDWLLLILFVLSTTISRQCLSISEAIEAVIQESMLKGKIPGLAIVVIKDGKEVLLKGYGYADVEHKIPVMPDTLFELGSTTKAFTGLAILKLVEERLISLEDPISKYLPWFNVNYNGQKAEIKIKDLLFHTSGIPFQTLAKISPSVEDFALEETVTKINNLSLHHFPSTHFEYATINYDVLGLIIQKVTGQLYEEYVWKKIVRALDLSQSYLYREIAYQQPMMAKGYKIGFLKANPFVAPTYRGNTPAGYLISTIRDVRKWLLHQLNPLVLKKVILQSHTPNDALVTFADNAFYAAGWFVIHTENGTILSHPGNNPNFSSYFAFSPEHQVAVGVLSNINTAYTMAIGQSVITLLLGGQIEETTVDTLQTIDFWSVILLSISFLIIIAIIFLLIRLIKSIYSSERRFYSIYRLLSLIVTIPFVIIFSLFIYNLPHLLIPEFNWKIVKIWGPDSLSYATYMFYALGSLSVLYIQLKFMFPRPNRIGHTDDR